MAQGKKENKGSVSVYIGAGSGLLHEKRRACAYRLTLCLGSHSGGLLGVGLVEEILLVLFVRLDLRKVHHTIRILVHAVPANQTNQTEKIGRVSRRAMMSQ